MFGDTAVAAVSGKSLHRLLRKAEAPLDWLGRTLNELGVKEGVHYQRVVSVSENSPENSFEEKPQTKIGNFKALTGTSDGSMIEIWLTPEVAMTILMQAIGRLRRTRSAYHKVVIVDSATPADGVRIHTLGLLVYVYGQPPVAR